MDLAGWPLLQRPVPLEILSSFYRHRNHLMSERRGVLRQPARLVQSGRTAVTSISIRARSSTSADTSTQVIAGKFFPITSR